MSHMLCIGYGRFPPQNMTDVWLTMLSMIRNNFIQQNLINPADLDGEVSGSSPGHTNDFKNGNYYSSARAGHNEP